MTDQQHPITPPPELIEDWIELAKPLPQRPPNPGELATLAARWGADQELEACCEWLQHQWKLTTHVELIPSLRKARRPKPPSLAEQSLALIDKIQGNKDPWDIRDLDVVRRALEELDD